MVESYGGSISMAPVRGCWRLAHVQTPGGMATLVRSDQQADTQQLILDYVADNSCGVVGLGDTRLGDDPSELTKMAQGIQVRVAREREEAAAADAADGDEGRENGKHLGRHATAAAPTVKVPSQNGKAPGSKRTSSSFAVSGARAASCALDETVTAPSCPAVTAGNAREAGNEVRSNSDEVIETHTVMEARGQKQHTVKPAKVQSTSAGSHKDENDVWRGGVALGSYDTALQRLFTVMGDCRGWGRYQGRIYQGMGRETDGGGGGVCAGCAIRRRVDGRQLLSEARRKSKGLRQRCDC